MTQSQRVTSLRACSFRAASMSAAGSHVADRGADHAMVWSRWVAPIAHIFCLYLLLGGAGVHAKACRAEKFPLCYKRTDSQQSLLLMALLGEIVPEWLAISISAIDPRL